MASNKQPSTVLLSPLNEPRQGVEGVDAYYGAGEVPQPPKDGIVIIEPTFIEFATADNASLAAPLVAASKMHDQPRAIIINLSYTPQNARKYKGYLHDIVDLLTSNGYPSVKTIHVPYQHYGSCLIGSRVAIIARHEDTELKFEGQTVYPAQAIPGLKYHAKSGSTRYKASDGSLAGGDSYKSEVDFLPALPAWGQKPLLCEYQHGKTLKQMRLREQDIRNLFGVTSTISVETLQYCTPPQVIAAEIAAVKG